MSGFFVGLWTSLRSNGWANGFDDDATVRREKDNLDCRPHVPQVDWVLQ